MELKTILLALGVVFAVAVTLWTSREELYLLRLRPIRLSEREAVTSICGRMLSEWPKENDSLADFMGQFERGELSAYVDEYARAVSIEVDGDRIVFSKQIFSQTPRVQSKIFTRFLLGGEEPLPELPPIDEIARRRD